MYNMTHCVIMTPIKDTHIFMYVNDHMSIKNIMGLFKTV